MEVEIRFYYSQSEYEKIKKHLSQAEGLIYGGSFHEITIQYDHPVKEFSFYNKTIDGRLRLRTSHETSRDIHKCKLSWKRRLEENSAQAIQCEEEVEVRISHEECKGLRFILEEVIKLPVKESYERTRTIYENHEIEISIDRYPFGIALELEQKNSSVQTTEVVCKWLKILGLSPDDAYKLSWDDKYKELCREQGVEIKSQVLLNESEMPKLEKAFFEFPKTLYSH